MVNFMPVVCGVCGESFTPTQRIDVAKYCSARCRKAASRAAQRTRQATR